VASDYAVLECVPDRLGAVTRPGLGEDAVDMSLDGRIADEQRYGDLAVRQTGRGQLEDLGLARA